MFDDMLDRRSGPDLALTPFERWERTICRERFGHYDPTSTQQRTWLNRQADQHLAEVAA